MSIETRYKQPSDVLDFNVDFAKWITDDDTITTIEAVVVEPAGTALVDAVQNISPIVKVWMSGGENNASYKVTVKVGTSLGRVKETEFRLRIREI